MLNAFAVNTRGRVTIAFTDGLLRKLELPELVGVPARAQPETRERIARLLS